MIPGILDGRLTPPPPRDDEFAMLRRSRPRGTTPAFEFSGDVPETMADFVERWGLRITPSDSFEYRPSQARVVQDVLEDTVDSVLAGPTGSGKTPTALLVAAWYLARGKPVYFIAGTHELVVQPFRTTVQRVGIPQHLCGFISQGASEREIRSIVDSPSVLLKGMTADRAVRLEASGRLVLDPEGLLIVDEVHEAVGEAAMARLLRARPKGMRALGLSANSSRAVADLIEAAGALPRARVIRLDDAGNFQSLERVQVPLVGEVGWAATQLAREITAQMEAVRHRLDRGSAEARSLDMAWHVDAGSSPIQWRIPAAGEQLALHKTIGTNRELDGRTRSEFWKLDVLYHYHLALTVFGVGEFFVGVHDRIRGVQKMLRKSESEGHRQGGRSSVEQVHSLRSFGEIYRRLAGAASFGDILKTGHNPPSEGELLEELRTYPGMLHPKEQRLRYILHRLPATVREEGVLVYTGRKFHAQLIAGRLHDAIANEGFEVSYLVGGQGTKAARLHRREVFDRISASLNQVVVGTSTVVHGIDSGVSAAILWDVPSPDKFYQLMGRTARRGQIGHVHTLVSDETQDEYRYHAAMRVLGARERKGR